MRKHALALLLGPLCLALSAAPALAQGDWDDEEDGGELDRVREGFFFGATANYAIDNFSLPDTGGFFGAAGRDFDRAGIADSWGFSLRGGWRFNRFLAAEGQFEYENEFAFHGNDVGVSRSTELATLKTLAFTANARGYVPGAGVLDGWLQPYGVAGFGLMHTIQRPTDDGIREAEESGANLGSVTSIRHARYGHPGSDNSLDEAPSRHTGAACEPFDYLTGLAELALGGWRDHIRP